MRFGVPGRVLEVNGSTATVDLFGVRDTVRLELVDEPVAPGDYILNNVGYAIRRIPDHHIEGMLALYEQMLRQACDGDDGDLSQLRDTPAGTIEEHGGGAGEENTA